MARLMDNFNLGKGENCIQHYRHCGAVRLKKSKNYNIARECLTMKSDSTYKNSRKKHMNKISVYIIAYNEAEKVADAIRSVAWADEVIVADSNSTDGTIEIAESLGAKVIQIPFQGFGALRNEAVASCTHDWIFSLDSDERCTTEAASEIKKLVQANEGDVYFVPRRNFFMGREIRHSGWYPNYRQPQLFRKSAMRYDNSPVHESFELNSNKNIGYLKNAIWQLPFKDLHEVIHKMNRYSTLGATKRRQKGSSYAKGFFHAAWAFLKHYIFKRGIFDGWPGFLIAFSYFEVTFYRYFKAVELEKKEQWDQDWKNISSR